MARISKEPCEFCKGENCVEVSQPNDWDSDYKIHCLKCDKVYWVDGEDG